MYHIHEISQKYVLLLLQPFIEKLDMKGQFWSQIQFGQLKIYKFLALYLFVLICLN